MIGKFFEQKKIFPSIEHAIERLCSSAGEAPHNAIVTALLKDVEASRTIERARVRHPRHSPMWIAGNMVAWFSQVYTVRPEELGDFPDRFQRKEGCRPYIYYRTGDRPARDIRQFAPYEPTDRTSSNATVAVGS